MTMIGTYPPSAFSFTVMVAGTGTALQLGGMADGSFQEASGLEAKIETEPVSEGGENGFVHQLPRANTSHNLVLRCGYVKQPSLLSEWVAGAVGSPLSQPIVTQTLVVLLLGSDHVPLVAWNLYRAWPIRWVTRPFDALKNELPTEVLEFSYAAITRMPLNEVAVSPRISSK